ncbi:MAG: anhydro-N-acetylmuramic acid kinase [Gammaproteobacteria bacterium]|nr:anhydro-N-acetylmuramic acid kinase [Gammaproteobacteria bacterium]
MSESKKLYIGVMSGTSLDGIDCVLVNFNGKKMQLIAGLHMAYPKALREKLLKLCQDFTINVKDLGCLHTELAENYSLAINALLNNTKTPAAKVCAIGNHGQTIYHYPEGKFPFTMQIGNAAVIAARTGIPVVADFRSMDMAMGGQGAPLVPAFHLSVFAKKAKNIAVVNIGGMANVTLLSSWIPDRAGNDNKNSILGFDTGPGNVLMDAWIQLHKKQPFDKNGAWAKSGKLNMDLLKALMSEPFFKRKPPKSTGRELFNLNWLKSKLVKFKGIQFEDVQATLLEFTAQTITLGMKLAKFKADEIYICGGGAFNHTLMLRIAALNPEANVDTSSKLGIDPSWIEAMAFAWLAKQTMEGKPGNLPSVTGAKQACILGAVYSPH